MDYNIELTEISINQLIRAVSQDAVAVYGKHSNDTVAELQVELSRVVDRWRDSLLTPETSDIPTLSPVIRYECSLGSCKDNNDHSEYDLFWIKHRKQNCEEYSAGWYCMYCIENEFGLDLINPPNVKPVSLVEELKRREVENHKEEVFKIK